MKIKEYGYAKSTKDIDLSAKSRDQDSQEEPWKTIPWRRFPPKYQPIFMVIVIHVEGLDIELENVTFILRMNIIPGGPS